MNKLFAPLYEYVYYGGHFSDDLYREGLYATIGLTCFFSSLFFVLLFYYIINRPYFSSWYHWLLILLIDAIVNDVVAIFLVRARFTELGYHYGSEYYLFGFANALVAAFIFILWSFLIRWWSTNARRTPIPH